MHRTNITLCALVPTLLLLAWVAPIRGEDAKLNAFVQFLEGSSKSEQDGDGAKKVEAEKEELVPGFLEIGLKRMATPISKGTTVRLEDGASRKRNPAPDDEVAKSRQPDAEAETEDAPPAEPQAQPRGRTNEETETESPTEIDPQLARRLMTLDRKVDKCLSYYSRQLEDAAKRSPWGIMHAMIAFESDTLILADGRKVNALAWLCKNSPCRGMRLLRLKNGRIYGEQGPGYQGHAGQFLAMLAQCNVRSTSPIRVGGRDLTVADLIREEMYSCESETELTFKLIGLSHYLKSDAEWYVPADRREPRNRWDIPRLIREELAQTIQGAACGGTHRLMSFSYAVNTRERRGEPCDGEWQRAKIYIDDYHKYTFRLQNPDGSFSTNFFDGRASEPDIDQRLKTTGHILEWLVFSLPEEELISPRVLAATNYLVDLMLSNHRQEWEVGPRGHALRALLLYQERVFKRASARAELRAELSTQQFLR